MRPNEYLGQVSDMVGIQKKFFQTPGISKNIFGNCWKRAVPLINILNLPIAAFEDWDAAKHGAYLQTTDHVQTKTLHSRDTGWILSRFHLSNRPVVTVPLPQVAESLVR